MCARARVCMRVFVCTYVCVVHLLVHLPRLLLPESDGHLIESNSIVNSNREASLLFVEFSVGLCSGVVLLCLLIRLLRFY